MCGIHGFITGSTREANADDFVKSGFIANMLRGKDSAGIASIDIPSEIMEYHKSPLPGMYFAEDRYASQLIRSASAANTITICHVRAATQGAVSPNNAHPFHHTNDEGSGFTRELIGVHNGSLSTWNHRTDAKGYDVDSDWALRRIFDDKFDAFENFSGAYCFVWWDSEESDVLNIALNDQRPMHVAFTQGGGMAFSSEAGMLYWLLQRHNISIKEHEGSVIHQLTPGNWYKFNVKNLAGFTKLELPKYRSFSSTTSTYSRSSSSYHSAYNHVNNVQKLLDTISAKESSKAEDKQSPTPLEELEQQDKEKALTVTKTEQAAAKEAGWLGIKGEFLGERYDPSLGILYGTFSVKDMDSAAFIRNMHASKIREGDTCHVAIIGMDDDGENLSLVCSKPRVIINDQKELVLH